jgi:cytochrome c553
MSFFLALFLMQAACGLCHGDDGNSKLKNMPSLAGQPEFFILNQLVLMREGVRPIEAKARPEMIEPALVQRGGELAVKLRCGSCHLPDLSGQQQVPRLARQRVDYLIHSMTEYRDNKRSGADTFMSNVVAGLSDADIEALAHYSASK